MEPTQETVVPAFISCHRHPYTYEIVINAAVEIRKAMLREADAARTDDQIAAILANDFRDRNSVIQTLRSMPWARLLGAARLIKYDPPVFDLGEAHFSAVYRAPQRVEAREDDPRLLDMPPNLFLSLMDQNGDPLLSISCDNPVAPERSMMMMLIRGDQKTLETHQKVALQLQEQIKNHPEGLKRPQFNH